MQDLPCFSRLPVTRPLPRLENECSVGSGIALRGDNCKTTQQNSCGSSVPLSGPRCSTGASFKRLGRMNSLAPLSRSCALNNTCSQVSPEPLSLEAYHDPLIASVL